VRPALTWETNARGRSAAAVYERCALALALALPVPLLAAAGMSLPLPQSIFRLGVLAAERTGLVADALPGRGQDAKTEAVRPVRAVRHAPAVARTGTKTHAAQQVSTRVAGAPVQTVHRRHRLATGSTTATTVTRSVFRPRPALASRDTTPITDPTPTTPTPTTPTPTVTTSTQAPAVQTTPPAASGASSSGTGSPPSSTSGSTKTDDKAAKAAADQARKDAKAAQDAAKAAADQAAKDAKAAQDAADKAAKAAADQAAKDAKAAQDAADRAAKAAADQARKDAAAAAAAVKKGTPPPATAVPAR
jgi:hypothetical protein